jgi:hypothetical protein
LRRGDDARLVGQHILAAPHRGDGEIGAIAGDGTEYNEVD